MEMSDNIGELAGALAKAQASLGKLIAGKTAKIPTKKGSDYSYTYADLADALEACRPTLNAEGISIIQLPATPERNGIEVRTMLAHSSGQWMRSDPLFMPVSGGAQDVGSAITYARRYQLLAMVGLAPEDDDGAKAQGAKPDSWGQRRAHQRQQPAPQRQSPQDKPRCVGKAAPIAAAIIDLTARLEDYKNQPGHAHYTAALRELKFITDEQQAPAPGLLFVDHGRAVQSVLKKWVTSYEGAPS